MKQAGRCWVDVCHCYIDVRTDPWGLQPSTPLKAINIWPTVPCTVRSATSLSNTHTRTRSVYCICTKGDIYKRITLWPSVLLQVAQSHTLRGHLHFKCESFMHRAFFASCVHGCLWLSGPVFSFYESFLIPFSQPVEATHSIQYRQTAHTHTHSHVNTHTQTTAVRYKARERLDK